MKSTASLPFPDRLELARTIYADRAGIAETIAEHVPNRTAYEDQAGAALADAFHTWNRVADRLSSIDKWSRPERITPEAGAELAAHLFAAALGCTTCGHIAFGAPGLTLVDLNRRLILCTNCMQENREPIVDQRCEICDQHVADNVFAEFVNQIGPCIYVGNLGVACCGHLQPGVNA